MAFGDCINVCANNQNPNNLLWRPPGSCYDSNVCGSYKFCDFKQEFEDPKYGRCMECPNSPGTTAEDCKTALAHISWEGYDFDECVKVCAEGRNPNGVKHTPNST